MTAMMKCFVMHGIGKVGVMDKPVPRPGPSDAIIRTTAALICTSDTHTVAGAIGDRQDLTLGHESVGVIHELGELAASGLFKVGQRVAVSAITPCYACDSCQRGYPSQCGGMLGGWKFANLKDGSFAEYFHVNNGRRRKSTTSSERNTGIMALGEPWEFIATTPLECVVLASQPR